MQLQDELMNTFMSLFCFICNMAEAEPEITPQFGTELDEIHIMETLLRLQITPSSVKQLVLL